MAEHELIWADTETGSTVDLKSAGTYRYAEDPSTHIQLFSYALNDGEVKIWDPHSGEEVPDDLCEYFDNPKYVFVFHNAQFDRLMIENCLGIRMPIQRYRCTMAQALSHALPAGLEKWEEVMGIKSDFQKIKDGKRLILKFCKPRKRKDGSMYWCTPETDPEDWARYKEYCRIDTAGMREASKKTPSFNYSFKGGTELEYWFMDQTINSRGLPIDLPLVNAAVEAIDDEQKLLSKKTRKMTNEEVQTAGQRDEMLKHIFGRYGIELPNMQKATLNKMVEDENLPVELRDLLQVRLSTCTTSTAKYKKLIKATCADGNLKGTIQYAGASRTLRDAGRGAQVQNWPRPKLKPEEIIKGIQHVMDGTVIENGFDTMELTSSMLRYCIAAPKDFKFVVADLAGIENRVLAYLAGEEWKLQAFREFDAGIGADMYKAAYSKSFKVDHESVTKDQRQIGKTLELSCLGPHTQVLTNNGYKGILTVLKSDLLWDGVQWVTHQGLVKKGVKKVVNVDGIFLTQKHTILVGKRWETAILVISRENTLRLALETGGANLPFLDMQTMSTANQLEWYGCNARAANQSIAYTIITYVKVKVQDVVLALKSNPEPAEKSIRDMPQLFRMIEQDVVYLTEYLPVLIDAIIRMTRHTIITVGEAYTFLKNGEKINENFYSILLRLKDGIISIYRWIGTIIILGMNRGIYGLVHRVKTVKMSEKLTTYRTKSTSWSPVYDIMNAGPRNRFTVKSDSGHLIVHNCGYQGGVGAIVTFALSFGINLHDLAVKVLPTVPKKIYAEAESFYEWLDEMDWKAATKAALEAKKEWLKSNDPLIEDMPEFSAKEYYTAKSTYALGKDTFIAIDSLKRLWRESHPKTVDFWASTEQAVRDAVLCPNRKFYFGNGLYAKRTRNWTKIVLPSGHVIPYPNMEIGKDGTLQFMGVDQFSKKWTLVKTFGGRLVENTVQAFSRSIFKHGQLLAEKRTQGIVMPLHDELVAKVPEDSDFTHKELEQIMATNPPWAPDIPLAAEGWEDTRYHK